MNGKQFRILAVLTVVSGFLGGAVSNLALRGAPALAQGGGAVQKEVRAREFVLVGSKGEVSGALTTGDDGSAILSLWGGAGAGNTSLTGGNSPMLIINDGDQLRGARLTPDSLSLHDETGASRVFLADASGGGLLLSDAAGKTRVRLSTENGPALSLIDATGHTRATVGCTATIHKKTGAKTDYPESTITLFTEDGTVQWQVPGLAPAAPIVAPVAPPVVGSGLGERYPGPMTGHWVKDSPGTGQYVVLEDGSLWEISVLDQIHTMLWLPTHKITIVSNPGDVLYPYKLVNMNRDQVVEAKYVGGR